MKLKQFLYIFIFYAIALSLKYYAVFEHPELTLNSDKIYASLFLGLGPLIGGLVAVHVFKRKSDLSIFGNNFVASLLITLLLICLFSGFSFYNTGIINIKISSSILFAILYSTFEEYGWRGYLQTELKPLNRILKYVVVSIFWFFWHLEFDMTLGNYFIILAGSFGLGYVADKSKSLLLVAIFHSLINLVLTSDVDSVSVSQKLISAGITAISIILYMRFGKAMKKQYS